jgi:hypothetical protein
MNVVRVDTWICLALNDGDNEETSLSKLCAGPELNSCGRGWFGIRRTEVPCCFIHHGRALIEQYSAYNGGTQALPNTLQQHYVRHQDFTLVVSRPKVKFFDMHVFVDGSEAMIKPYILNVSFSLEFVLPSLIKKPKL